MKLKAVSGIMVTLLLIGMLTLAFKIQPVKAEISPYSPADAISILPPQRIYESDVECYYNETEFTVQVYITNVTDCAGYDFVLYYNKTLLEVTEILIDTGAPLSPTQIAPEDIGRVETDVSEPGIVRHSVCWKWKYPNETLVPTYNGSGVAAQLTFKIIYCPPQIVADPQQNNTVSSDLTFDRFWTIAIDYWGDEILFAKINDGYYEYTTIGRVPLPPVGGKATPINIPVNKPETPTLWIWLTTIILSLVVTVVYVKKRKKHTEINS